MITSSDAPAPVHIRGLVKRFRQKVAVAGVDLDVASGEVVGFLGPNGAGKTTVLRVLTGALRASQGDVTLCGLDPFTDGARAREQVGYLPGDLRLPGDLTGGQVLDLCAAGRRDPGSARDELVGELDVPLAVPVAALSKGNRQKLGIVQALMSRPKVLLLDEPTSGLDPLAQQVLENRIRAAAEGGAAVLLSSHVLAEVQEVAHRVVMLREGAVVASSRLDELRAAAPHDVTLQLENAEAVERVCGALGVLEPGLVGGKAHFSIPSESLSVLLAALTHERVKDVSITPADLESLFGRYYERT